MAKRRPAAARRIPTLEALEPRLCMAAPTFQTSFVLPTNGPWTPSVYRASPLFVTIPGTGKDELIAVTSGARLVAYAEGPNGSAVAVATYLAPGAADIKSTPIVVTDPRTGRLDLFAAMGRDENTNSLNDGRVFGWDLQTATLLPGWTNGQSTGVNVAGQAGVYGALTSGVLEANGMPDIVATSFSHNVTAFRLDGSTIWQWTNDDTILSGAVIGDIDRSGTPSIVVGGDSSNSPFYQAGGWVNVLSNTGTLKWRHFIPGEVTWSSPVLGDLNNNGYLDIVIGTGLNYDYSGVPGARALGNNIYALDPFGNVLPGWPYHTTSNDAQAHQVLASPAIADLLGNGQLDVVAVDRSGFVHAIQPNGQPLPAFVGGRSLAPEFPPGTLPDDFASPVVADINGGGHPSVIAGYGPFLKGIDGFGNITPIAQTPINYPATTPEGIDTAPAIGNFSGGPGLTLAFVSYNVGLQNRPDAVQIFRLPPTALAPPWPMMRRTASGDALARSNAFDSVYVANAFMSAQGYLPDPAIVRSLVSALNSNTIDLLTAAYLIDSGPQARQAQVQNIFLRFLGHYADPNALASWTNFLASGTYRDMEELIASGTEFAQRSGNSLPGEVYNLYHAILGRDPSPQESSSYVGANLAPAVIAGQLLNGREYLGNQLFYYYPTLFGPGAGYYVPADALGSYIYSIHRGAREEVLNAQIYATNGQLGATNFLAGYTQDLYRDILKRNASSAEVFNWLQAFDQGTVFLNQEASILLNTPEARANYIQQEFVALLGHTADPGTVASILNYPNRESVVITLVGSPEYSLRNGGTPQGFVTAVYRDLGGIVASPSVVNDWVNRFATGTPRVGLAQAIIYGGGLYFYNLAVQEVMQYLPNEFQGVLRSGNLSPNAPGQPINPDPNIVNYIFTQSPVVSDEQLIAQLLNTYNYYHRASYFKGVRRVPGIRY